MQKTKIRLAIAAIAILAASAAILTSCDKSELDMNLVEQTKLASVPDDDCAVVPDIEGKYNPGKLLVCSSGLPTNCDYSIKGNCSRPAVVVDTLITNCLVSNGPSFVVEFFSGEVWKNYWPNIDTETIDKLVSGEYYFHKIKRSQTSWFYVATKSVVIDTNTEYLVALPVKLEI